MTGRPLGVRLEHLARRHTRALRLSVQLGIIAVIVLAIATVGFVEYSAQPGFCDNCHVMEPYYESWSTSTHNTVPCIKCHYAPGIKAEAMGKLQAANQVVKYITGAYSTKPWAEIEDAACLRSGCHVEARLEVQVDFQGVRFNHAHHLGELRRGKQLRCTSCHSQIVQGDHVSVTEATCFLCHFKQRRAAEPIAGCVGCHPSPPRIESTDGPVVDHPQYVEDLVSCVSCHDQVTRGDGAADQPRCFNCHNEPERVAEFENTTLLHRVHISERNVECTQCHSPIEHRIVAPPAPQMALNCGSCHRDVHEAQRNLLAGVGGHGVDETPAPMFTARVACVSCHARPQDEAAHERVSLADESSCLSCHGVKYANILPAWRDEMDRRVSAVARALAQITAARRAGSPRSPYVVDSLIALARENVEIVQVGRGPHNIAYADALLRAAVRYLRDAAEVGDLDIRPPSVSLGPAIGANRCLQCHLGIDRQEGTYHGRRFPHERHVGQPELDCETCHTPHEDHGKITVQPAQCAQCHHQSAEPGTCSRCHEGVRGAPRDTFDVAIGRFQHEPHVSIRFACEMCHRTPPRSARDLNCDNCHAPHHQPTTTCASCHQSRVKDRHALSFAHTRCTQCHGSKVEGVTEWSRNVCTVCHTDRVDHNAPVACHLCHDMAPLTESGS